MGRADTVDGIDFSKFDNDDDDVVDRLIIVHAKFGREDKEGDYIWSHRHYLNWFYGDLRHVSNGDTVNGYAIVPELHGCDSSHVKIGVFCHEYGHLLGLPDLYDPDGSSNGIGTWGLMGLGGWGANCNSPHLPTHMCAWSKVKLGWATPVVPKNNSVVWIPIVEDRNKVFQLWTNGDPAKEYFLLENRKRIGFDIHFSHEGLLIWHVDETVVDRRGRFTNRNDDHRAVDLEAADGEIDTLGTEDPFEQGGSLSFNTDPNSRDYRGNDTYVEVHFIDSDDDSIKADLRIMSSPSGTPDLVIRDCINDVGSEPNGACLNDVVRSPDIWIDNDGDGEPDPYAAGVVNRLWARIWNIGDAPATDVNVTFWRADPTLGLRIPDGMVSIYDDITGDSIVSVSLVPANSLSGKDTTIVFIDAILPDPPYCFGVIVENDEDPQTDSLALLDNNVAQLNMWSERQLSVPGDPTLFTSKLYVTNPTDVPDTFEVTVDEDMLPPGWTASVEPETFYLESDMDSCAIEVTVPAGTQHDRSCLVHTNLYRLGETDTSLGAIVLDAGIDNIKPKAINDLTALILRAEGDNFSTDESTVRLSWLPVQFDSAGNPEKIRLYYIYRDTITGFVPNSTNPIDSVAADEDMLIPEFQWDDEPEFTPGMAKARSPQTYYPTFYYKVISVDRAGNRSDPSNEVYPRSAPVPMLHLLKSDGCRRCGLEADNIVIKPDMAHDVCLYIEDIQPDYDIETIHFMLTWNGDLQFMRPGVVTFDCTDLDSSGWDIKYHQDGGPGAGRDSVEVWLISGGNAQCPLGQAGCILRIGFHTQASAQPGDRDTIHFEFAEWNEGGETGTNDFYKRINEPPVITWFGQDAPDTIDAVVLHEGHFSTYLIDAHDYDIDCNYPCGDSIILWAQSDPLIDPCPWVEGAAFDTVGQTDGLEQVLDCGFVEGEFVFHPPKLGICDDFWVDFIAVSTWQTGQPLYDTLTVHFLVQDCELLVAWPETTWHAGGWIEIPVRIHPDYDCLADLDVTAAYFELSYDPSLMTVGEVGNEGLFTEDWGALTFNLDEANGKIFIAMAGNYPLLQCDPLCTWYDILYVGFEINPETVAGDSAVLSIEHVKFNEGDPTACWIDTTYFEVVRYSISGTVELCSTGVAVDSVLMTLTWDIDLNGFIDEVMMDTTDVNGDYMFDSLYGSTGEYCLIPSKEGGLGKQTITSLDASLILRSLTGLGLDSCQMEAADVTGDGTVSAFDASVILKYVVTENAGTPLIPEHNIGTWLFFPPQRCYQSISEDYTDEDFYAVLVGDVTKNWPGPAPKRLADGMEAVVRTNDITVDFAEPVSAVDMKITYGANLKVVSVSAGAEAVEWMAQANELRVAAASARSFQDITITFEQLTPTDLEISARVDESIMMTAATKVVPVPVEYALAQNYPNPFNPMTDIRYQIADNRSPVHTTLKIYNILGQKVRTLVEETKEPGYYTTTWNGKDASGNAVASGVYLYRLTAGDFTATKRMVLMK